MDELLDGAPCGFLSCDADGSIVLANALFCRWLGYQAGELEGQPLQRVLSMGGRLFHQTHILPLLKLKGEASEIYFTLKARDGTSIPVLTNAAWRERDGAFFSDYVFLPLTQRHEYEAELLQAKKMADEATKTAQEAQQRAAEASRAKARFLSMMSHELRTPMNAILGFGQLLQTEALEPEQHDSVTHIVNAGRHLLELINEVLDLSRIEAGHPHVSPTPLMARVAMREAFEMAQPLAAKAGIQLEMPPGPCDAMLVQADPGRLRQILLNLLSNAIKYNRESGSVTLLCEPAPGPGEEAEAQEIQRLRLVVRDTGKGIPAHQMEKLFVPFERLDAENSEIEGTGLGLTVCQRLAEAMDGHIGVQSAAGEGSCFWIELPQAQAQPAGGEAAAAPEHLAASTSLVLYIEDNELNLTLMQRVLARRPSVRLLPASSGALGLQLARAHFPSLILLDLQLPDMTGHAVLRQLRQLRDDERTRNIPVVVLSADATPEQSAHLLQSGAAHYVAKPLEVASFLRILDAQLAHSSAAST